LCARVLCLPVLSWKVNEQSHTFAASYVMSLTGYLHASAQQLLDEVIAQEKEQRADRAVVAHPCSYEKSNNASRPAEEALAPPPNAVTHQANKQQKGTRSLFCVGSWIDPLDCKNASWHIALFLYRFEPNTFVLQETRAQANLGTRRRQHAAVQLSRKARLQSPQREVRQHISWNFEACFVSQKIAFRLLFVSICLSLCLHSVWGNKKCLSRVDFYAHTFVQHQKAMKVTAAIKKTM